MSNILKLFGCTAWVIASVSSAVTVDAQPIKRWIDDRGMVHYSDAPPPPEASSITEIEPTRPLTDSERVTAAQRMQHYRQVLARPTDSAPASANATSASSSSDPKLPTGNSCEDQWARFNASYACMDPYRLAGGGVRPEAFQHCPQLPKPNCPAPHS